MNWLENVYQCRAAEQQIRSWLSEHGYSGNQARIHQLDLYAVQAPGWVQVYRFVADLPNTDEPVQPVGNAVTANSGAAGIGSAMTKSGENAPTSKIMCRDTPDVATGWVRLYGACRDDQRHRTEIAVYQSPVTRDHLLSQWSSGLSRRKGKPNCKSHCIKDLLWFALALAGIMVVLAFVLR